MDDGREREIQVERDLRHLSTTLTGHNLLPEVMFAEERGIRSCTPPFDTLGIEVSERLKRVQPPEE